jgi:hypothetical protein
VTLMPGDYFRAKYLWEHGDRDGAYELLRQAIGSKIGADPFVRPDYLMAGSSIEEFESLVSNLLPGTFVNSAQPFLLAPFGRVWAALWELDPYNGWIDLLLRYDFFRAPEAIGFDLEEFAPPQNEDRDFDAIIHALEASARSGKLSPDPADDPNGGRPVLALASIDAVEDTRWGPLKPRLTSRLTDAYSSSPTDPWKRRLEDDPEGVVTDFLHHLFSRYGEASNSSIEPRWRAIRRAHPAYAEAVRSALAKLLGSVTATRAADIVKFDARRGVSDGAAWLHDLAQALDSGSFSNLG